MSGELRRVVIAFETEAAARARLVAHGFSPDIAAEIAVYLAQSTDLPAFMPEIAEALAAGGISAEFVELDNLLSALQRTGFVAAESLLWNVTDGIRFYRGSAVPALARVMGVPRYGSPPTAQHVCQDKLLSLALATSANVSCPSSILMEGQEQIASVAGGNVLALLSGFPGAQPIRFFVKPNTLGAKIGIFADSLCDSFEEACERSARIWDRYRDRALIQGFIPGDDVRVSFLDTGGSFREQLGIFRMVKDARSETGGEFMTMKDNETLSGARDTSGTRGGFGATHEAAFVPVMQNLRDDPAATAVVAAVEVAATSLATTLGLSDCFSMDFRIDSRTGKPVFFEFEVCPAVTIYDFQVYLQSVHGLPLGAALAQSFRLAHRRAGGMDEA